MPTAKMISFVHAVPIRRLYTPFTLKKYPVRWMGDEGREGEVQRVGGIVGLKIVQAKKSVKGREGVRVGIWKNFEILPDLILFSTPPSFNSTI